MGKKQKYFLIGRVKIPNCQFMVSVVKLKSKYLKYVHLFSVKIIDRVLHIISFLYFSYNIPQLNPHIFFRRSLFI